MELRDHRTAELQQRKGYVAQSAQPDGDETQCLPEIATLSLRDAQARLGLKSIPGCEVVTKSSPHGQYCGALTRRLYFASLCRGWLPVCCEFLQRIRIWFHIHNGDECKPPL